MDHPRLVVVSKGGDIVGLWLQEIALFQQLPSDLAFLLPSWDDFLLE